MRKKGIVIVPDWTNLREKSNCVCYPVTLTILNILILEIVNADTATVLRRHSNYTIPALRITVISNLELEEDLCLNYHTATVLIILKNQLRRFICCAITSPKTPEVIPIERNYKKSTLTTLKCY